ncbi:MAG: AraC family transcriptional regulator [Firmicutes bacterium]|nr:AraC family transcriptional regulator [Bacillota bacterium]
MKTAKEKIAYLRGLLEGGNLSGKDSGDRVLWDHLLDILDDLAVAINALSANQDELGEYVEAIDSDLMELEEEVYGDADDDEDWVEVECPECGEPVTFEEGFLYDDDVQVTCPECGGVVHQGENFQDYDELFDYEDEDDEDEE